MKTYQLLNGRTEDLIDVNNYDTIKFAELELVICQPELTGFNSLVRDKLIKLEIDFKVDN